MGNKKNQEKSLSKKYFEEIFEFKGGFLRQQEEMNLAVQANPNNLTKLVSKHVEQVQVKKKKKHHLHSQIYEEEKYICSYFCSGS